LEHFLPTQISVIAIYGRLFTLATNIANHFSMDMEETLGVPKQNIGIKRKRERASDGQPAVPLAANMHMELDTPAGQDPEESFDLGQRIERPSMFAPSEDQVSKASSPVSIEVRQKSLSPPSDRMSSASPQPSSPDPAPSPIRIPTPEPVPKKKKRTISASDSTSTKAKVKGKGKKKRDDMDDIFGF
jgi:hypothetical protein